LKANDSIRSRLKRVSRKLHDLIEEKKANPEELAKDILRHHQFRWQHTHEGGVVWDGDKSHLQQDGYAVFLPGIDSDDDDSGLAVEFHTNQTDAEDCLRQHWGEVDDDFTKKFIQKVVFEPQMKEDYKKKSKNLGDMIKSLVEYHNGGSDHRLDWPDSYPSADHFIVNVQQKQGRQLEELGKLLEEHTRRDAEGRWTIVSKETWNSNNNSKDSPYPFLKPIDLKIYVPQNKSVFDLMAIEEYLFAQEADVALVALAKAHTVLGDAMGHPGIRKDLLNAEAIGCRSGKGDSLHDLIKEMTETGWDIQPVFDGHRCVGTLELNNIMNFLRHHPFTSLPKVIEMEALKEAGLLSPAPIIIDASTPVHQVAELMYSGLGAVLIEYVPSYWADSPAGEFLAKWMMPGYHIMTVHDLVQHKILLSQE
jgi:predicted transcriptional regulator